MSKIKTTEELVNVATQFFENYPTHDEVFVTEDGQAFFEENRAILHADYKNFSYKRFVRGFEGIQQQESKSTISSQASSNSPEYRGTNPDEESEKYAEKVKELQELDTKDYQQLKALVQYFGLKTENLKAETLLKALEEFKQKTI